MGKTTNKKYKEMQKKDIWALWFIFDHVKIKRSYVNSK